MPIPPDHVSRPRALTVHDVKRMYGWSRSKTYELLGSGRLAGVKMGSKLLILTDSCEQLLAALPKATIKAHIPKASVPATREVTPARARRTPRGREP